MIDEGDPMNEPARSESEAPPEAPPALRVIEGAEQEAAKASRTKWDMAENRIVATEVARLLNTQNIRYLPESDDREGRIFLKEFVATAQLKLPRDRRRLTAQLAAFSDVFWKLVRDAITNKSYLAQPGSEIEQASTNKPSGTEAPAPAAHSPSAPAVVPPEGFALVNGDHPLGNVPIAALLAEVSRRFDEQRTKTNDTEQLLAMLADDMNKAERQGEIFMKRLAAMEGKLQIVPAAPEVLPRLVIVGCKRYEFEHISHNLKTLGIRLDLRHYDQDATVPAKVNADWAISLKWLSHATWDRIEKSVPAGQAVFIHGGVGMAVSQIKAWFQQ